jgi:formamidopyrimidine-DNA glycosylase
MPELPEVEVTRRGIAGPLMGAVVLRVRVGKPLRWPLGQAPERLRGLVVGDVSRRGKYLWLPLALPVSGAPAASAPGGLLMHLGMSGSLALVADDVLPGAHDHFDLCTDRGTLRLNDPRRFGAVVWSSGLDQAPAFTLLRHLGAEPFDPALTPQSFHAALQRRRAPIKAVLLAGDVMVGAGNIYACEALFMAGIHPGLRADLVSRPRAQRLLQALRLTLARALELGGSTLRDFTDVHGVSGSYQTHAAVYGRAGQACGRCSKPVRRLVQAQRSTYFCAHCQRR